MQRLIVLLIVAALGWYGYTKYQGHVRVQPVVEAATPQAPADELHPRQYLKARPRHRSHAMVASTVRK